MGAPGKRLVGQGVKWLLSARVVPRLGTVMPNEFMNPFGIWIRVLLVRTSMQIVAMARISGLSTCCC